MAKLSSPTGSRDFWEGHSEGVDVAVGSAEPHKLLGVREAFEVFVRQTLGRDLPIHVQPFADVEQSECLPMADEEAIFAARQECLELEERLGGRFVFYVGNEGGLHSLDVAGHQRHFVRSWSVVRQAGREAWGASGSVQLPVAVGEGLDSSRGSLVLPGRRRSEGLVSALTHGLSDRRAAVQQATVHALGTLFYPG